MQQENTETKQDGFAYRSMEQECVGELSCSSRWVGSGKGYQITDCWRKDGNVQKWSMLGVMQISGLTGKTNERGMSDYVRYACSKYFNGPEWRS